MKMERIKYLIIMFLLTIVLASFTWYSTFSNNSGELSLSDGSTFVFLGIMFVIMIISSYGILGKIDLISKDFLNNSKRIKSNMTGSDDNISFEDNKLSAQYNRYKTQNLHYRKTGVIDITDYLNISFLNSLISKNMCEAIPGIMTGLGILGTFAGLILGLRDFKIDFDVMQNSIMMLLNGIKTAFLTSIFGVIYSILFNILYRRSFNIMLINYEGFINDYYTCIQPNSQNDFYNRLIISNENQMNSMSEFANKIGNIMVDKFDKSMNSIDRGIKEFMSKAIVTQDEKMKSLVKLYLTEMNNNVFGGELEQLRDTLNKINTNERENSEKIKKLVNIIDERTDDIIEVNNGISDAVSKTRTYVDQIQNYQNDVQNMNNIVNDRIAVLSDTVKKNNSLIDQISEVQDKIFENVRDFNNTFSKFDSRIDSMFDQTEETLKNIETGIVQNRNYYDSSIETYRKQLDDTVINYSAKLESVAEQYNEKQNNNTNELMKRLDDYISKYNFDISNSLENVNTTMQKIESNMHNSYDDIIAATKNMTEESLKLTGSLRAIVKNFENAYENISTDFQFLNKQTLNTSKNIHGNSDELIRKNADMLNDINNSISAMSGVIEKSLNRITSTCEKANKDMYNNTVEVIKEFEKSTIEVSKRIKELYSLSSVQGSNNKSAIPTQSGNQETITTPGTGENRLIKFKK